jgi:alpha-glucosidase
MYMNMPFFYGVQPASGSVPAFVYGVFFDNPCRATFRMGTQIPTGYSFEAADGQMDYYFFGGSTNHTMKSVINSYTELTGRAEILPKWGMGHQLSRFAYDDQSWVEYIANTATASNIPARCDLYRHRLPGLDRGKTTSTPTSCTS